METVKSFEPVTRDVVSMIGRTIGGISAMVVGLGDVDLSAGAGVIDSKTKCLWDSSGRRITVGLSSDGGCICSRSKEKDADYQAGRF